MGDGGLDGQLSGDVQHATANANGDLRAYDLGGGAGFGAVADHEADAEEVDECTGTDVVFVMAGVFNDERYADGSDGRGESEGVGDVSCSRDGVVLNNLEVGEEVRLDGGVEDGEVEEAD